MHGENKHMCMDGGNLKYCMQNSVMGLNGKGISVVYKTQA